MLINHKNKSIFIHNPKTGGGSISKSLKNNGYTDYLDTHDLYNGQFKDYFKFCFIRNPFSLVISNYRFIQYRMGNTTKNMPQNELTYFKESKYYSVLNMSINEFINYLYYEMNRQHLYIKDMDFVGRYENFNKDYKQICEKLNISFDLENTIHNYGKYNYRDYYDPMAVNLIEYYFATDLKVLKYGFSGE